MEIIELQEGTQNVQITQPQLQQINLDETHVKDIAMQVFNVFRDELTKIITEVNKKNTYPPNNMILSLGDDLKHDLMNIVKETIKSINKSNNKPEGAPIRKPGRPKKTEPVEEPIKEEPVKNKFIKKVVRSKIYSEQPIKYEDEDDDDVEEDDELKEEVIEVPIRTRKRKN